MAHSYDLSGTDVEVQLLLRLLFDVDPSPEEVSLRNSGEDFHSFKTLNIKCLKTHFLSLNVSVNTKRLYR